MPNRRRAKGEGGLGQRHDHPTCPPPRPDGTRPKHACRGRWAGKLRTAKVVLLRPEVYDLFGSDEAINAALTVIAQLRDVVVPRKRRARAA